MKKQLLFITAFLALASASFSQTPTYRTTEFVGNIPANDEYAVDMCKDSNGNMYAVGQLNNGASLDISVTKFDVLGNLLWEKTYDNGGDDIPLNIEIGESDNIYVTGNSEDGGTPKGLIIKYNENGIIQWQVHPGGISGITVLESNTRGFNGETYLVGSFMGSVTDQKAIIYKYLSDGTSDWTEVYDYSSSIDDDDDEFSAISINPYNGDIYVGGMANGTKILLVKYNSSGTEQWTKTPRNGKVLDLTSGGSSFSYNVYIAAQTSVSFPDAYTAKYNSSGNMQWEDTYTDGSLNGSAEIHYFNSNIYVAYQHQAGSSNPDTKDFIRKYNTSGTEQWTIDNMYLGLYTPGEFSVSNNAELLSFDGSYLYCLEGNLEVWRYNLTDPFNDFDVFYNNINPQYTSLANDPEIVLPVKSLVNNNIIYLLGDGKYNATDNSRIALSSYCYPEDQVIIDAPTDACGDLVSVNSSNANSVHWNAGVISGGSVTSFSDVYATNPTVQVTYTNEMTMFVKIRGEDVNTCPSYDYKEITFHNNPAPVISGDLEYCEGASAALDAGTGYSVYTWSNADDTQISNVTSGTYTVEVEDAYGCIGTSASVTVTENALPVINLGADQTECEGETVTLDAGTFDAYLWNTGASSQTIDVTTTGDYIIEVTDANSCSNSDTIHVQFDDCTGINTIENNNLSIYPNPAQDYIVIAGNAKQFIENIQIFDITGKSVKTVIASGAKQSVDISTLQNGVYFVKVNTSEDVKTIRMVKK